MRASQFETLGLRRVYVWVAGIVHEPLLPATDGELGGWTKPSLVKAQDKTKYFGPANLARAGCYVPQAIAFSLFKFWPGLLYVFLVWGAHLTLVAVENYKRRLCDHWMPLAPDEEPKQPRTMPLHPTGIYRLRSFETERFYQRIGIEHFRRFSVWIMSGLTFGFTGRRLTFIAQPSRKQAVSFELETRVSEAVHLSSAVSVMPLVVLSWVGAPWSIAVWSTLIVIGDLLLSLLQRYHRARAWPVVKRFLDRVP